MAIPPRLANPPLIPAEVINEAAESPDVPTATKRFGEMFEIFSRTANAKIEALVGEKTELNRQVEILKESEINNLVFFFGGLKAKFRASKYEEGIEKISTFLQEHPDAFITVTGHADNTGLNSVRIKRGNDRAKFVKSLITRKGIEASRIKTDSAGSSQRIRYHSVQNCRATVKIGKE